MSAQLRRQILAGELAPGAALLGERTLSGQLGVSRVTLRAALSRLQAEGLVEPRQGDAVRVLDWRRHGTMALLPHVVDNDGRLVAGFLELRRALAAETIALACERGTAAQRTRLRELADAQMSEQDPDEFRERDLLFTRALLEAAGNDALMLLFNSVEAVYRARPELADAMLADLDRVRLSYDWATRLVERRDGENARSLVRPALQAQDEQTLKRLRRREPARRTRR